MRVKTKLVCKKIVQSYNSVISCNYEKYFTTKFAVEGVGVYHLQK